MMMNYMCVMNDLNNKDRLWIYWDIFALSLDIRTILSLHLLRRFYHPKLSLNSPQHHAYHTLAYYSDVILHQCRPIALHRTEPVESICIKRNFRYLFVTEFQSLNPFCRKPS